MRNQYLSVIKAAVFCLVLLARPLSVSAQKSMDDEAVRTDLDAMFSGLDMSRVPTGYLRDYAFEHVDFDYYDGTALTDTNYVDPKALEEILNAVNSAAVDNAHIAVCPQRAAGKSEVDGFGNVAFKTLGGLCLHHREGASHERQEDIA